jgi:hypothetical protein
MTHWRTHKVVVIVLLGLLLCLSVYAQDKIEGFDKLSAAEVRHALSSELTSRGVFIESLGFRGCDLPTDLYSRFVGCSFSITMSVMNQKAEVRKMHADMKAKQDADFEKEKAAAQASGGTCGLATDSPR